MSCPISKPIPNMYAENIVSKPRRTWYEDHQHKHFSAAIGKEELKRIYYDADSFVKFLDEIGVIPGYSWLRIYIGRYGNSDEPDVPRGLDKNLTLIFVPLTEHYNEMEYYIFHSKKSYKAIGSQKAGKLLDNYESTRMPIPDDKAKDTICITHSASNIEQFRSEIICQGADGVRAYFAAFTDSENSPILPKYKNRLMVQFALTKKQLIIWDKEINIEETPNYKQRKLRKRPEDFDNGTLCPPCQNCYDQNVSILPPEC